MLIVNALTCANLSVLFCLLFFRKSNPVPNRVLAFLFIIPAFYSLDNIFVLSGVIDRVPYFFFFVQIIAIFFPPLFYLYINLLLGEKQKFNIVLTAGSVLSTIYIIVLTVKFAVLPPADKLQYLNALNNDSYPTDMLLYTISFYIWQMAYFSVSTYKVYKYSRSIHNSLSSMDQVKILYLKRFVSLFWILNLALVVMYIAAPIYYVDYLLLPVCVNIIYIFILYFSYNYNAIFTELSFKQLNEANSIIEQTELLPVDISSQFETEKHKKAYDALQKAIVTENIHRNPDLTLPGLAAKLNMPAYLLSQTINHYYKKPFFDLINELRIKEADERLKKMGPRETVEGIAYETGFNSRTSFYRAYKKYTGQTPTNTITVSKQ